MRVLFLGDIVGSPGRGIISRILPGYREKEKIDCVVANGENAAGGSGLTPGIADQLFESGIDVMTSGDHIWKKSEIYDYLKVSGRLLRPANYPEGAPGRGSAVADVQGGGKIAVINLVGRVFMDAAVECPFLTVNKELEKLKGTTPVILVDMHAEATSEKVALGWFLAGRVSAVFGTHTHIQTADEKILPGGTAYLTDSGMTGPYESVIGRKAGPIIERFMTQLPVRFEMAEGDVQMHGAIVDIDDNTGKALTVKRVQEKDI